MLEITDHASFIGFPGDGGAPWFDQEWNLPIARGATIASIPWKPFINSAISTEDTMLVSGMSFSGSSGSPVLSHEKGVEVHLQLGSHPPRGYQPGQEPRVDSEYREWRLIGIMSGHFANGEGGPAMLMPHAGLSYLTRSTSILKLIATARADRWRRSH